VRAAPIDARSMLTPRVTEISRLSAHRSDVVAAPSRRPPQRDGTAAAAAAAPRR
jgi:hypothetical protein